MLDYRERISLLMKLRDVMKGYEKEIYQALKNDLGKSAFEAYETEIGLILVELNYTIKYLSSWMKFKTVPTPFSHMPATSMVYREPFGRVLIISPWNYPFHLTLIPLINAWAAGNEVTIKPSELSTASEKVIYEMLTENFHTSRVRVMTGGPETTMDLLEKKFDFIFFTGSTRVGKIVMQEAAKQLTPVCMQLGGKSPCVIDRSCNLKAAAKRIVRGKFVNCGQSSTAPEFVLIDETKKDDFIRYMQRYIWQFYGREPLKSPDYGKIINHIHFYRLMDLIEHQEILIGGEFDIQTLQIAPTVVAENSLCSNMMKTEIFGPILPILTYQTWEEAMDKIARFHHAPALYLFTKEKRHEEYIKNCCIAGSICINDTMLQATTPYLPFGGVGNSGTGRYHGKAGFDTFSNIKSVMKRSNSGESTVMYPPYAEKMQLLKRILK
jgi:aldehyde dehydrogenase (NAD+)